MLVKLGVTQLAANARKQIIIVVQAVNALDAKTYLYRLPVTIWRAVILNPVKMRIIA